MSGASIDRIDGGGTIWGIKKTRSCKFNVGASTLVPCVVSDATLLNGPAQVLPAHEGWA